MSTSSCRHRHVHGFATNIMTTLGSRLEGISSNGEEQARQPRKSKTAAALKRKRAPREMSASAPIPEHSSTSALHCERNSRSRPKSLDPRFNSASGTFNEDLFKKSYSFVEQYQRDELKQLMAMKKKQPGNEDIQKRAQQLKSKLDHAEREARISEKKRAFKKEQKQRVLEGSKPYYLSRKGHKMLRLQDKFEELKSGGRLDAFVAKKKRRAASRMKKAVLSSRKNSE